MPNVRLIARLDIKGPNLIKGVHLEGLRVMGDPQVFAQRYYEQGTDEIIYMDTVASLYGRDNIIEIVRHTAQKMFIPMTVGGGVRSVEDATTLLRAGADKIAINTSAVLRPELITEMSRRFGSQCMVLSIEAKRSKKGDWEVYTNNGREHTDLDAVEWAKRGEKLGAGEILLTSVDQEGTLRGFDIELVKVISSAVSIPVIASGGMGKTEHLTDVVKKGGADAVAIAKVLHYNKITFPEMRQSLKEAGVMVRNFDPASFAEASHG